MRVRTIAVVALSLVAGCSRPGGKQGRTPHELSPPVEPYVRVSTAESNIVQLQIAVRKFVPARGKGPAVWLTGVSHIGETNYYAALQRQLDAQSLVLYEGIGGPGPEGEETPRAEEDSRAGTGTNSASAKARRSSLQSSLAASLGLVFQLEAVDYARPNFRNCDLSLEQLRQLMAEERAASGQPGPAQSFETLLQMMEGDSLLDTIVQMAMRFLGANPKLQAMSKLALIETIAQMKGDPSQLRGLPPQLSQLLEVLVQKRNQKVVDELKAELKSKERPRTIAIFFGTGHMPDLEKRLREEVGYRPAEEIWLTAFSVNLREAGVSQSEKEVIRGFVKREMEQLQTPR